MIEHVASVELPVDEKLKIEKYRWTPQPGRDGGKRFSVVTGIHGDELEGQYVCYEVGRTIREHPVQDVAGSDMVLDIHASNAYLTEVPQIRINTIHKERLLPYARSTNVDLIWVHSNATVLESTFAYSLNSIGTPVLVIEMGIGMRITRSIGDQVTCGIFHLMHEMGIWEKDPGPCKDPVISTDPDEICYLNAPRGGIYIADVRAGENVEKDQIVGRLVSPLTGEVFEKVRAPETGWMFTQRDYPLTAAGSLMGRILIR